MRLRRLVKEALRMPPDRIIVGEVRQEECLDLLVALSSGLPVMFSIHANSAGDKLVRTDGFPPHPERFARAGYDRGAAGAVDVPLMTRGEAYLPLGVES